MSWINLNLTCAGNLCWKPVLQHFVSGCLLTGGDCTDIVFKHRRWQHLANCASGGGPVFSFWSGWQWMKSVPAVWCAVGTVCFLAGAFFFSVVTEWSCHSLTSNQNLHQFSISANYVVIVVVGLEPIPAVLGWRRGCSLGQSLVYHRATEGQTTIHTLTYK